MPMQEHEGDADIDEPLLVPKVGAERQAGGPASSCSAQRSQHPHPCLLPVAKQRFGGADAALRGDLMANQRPSH